MNYALTLLCVTGPGIDSKKELNQENSQKSDRNDTCYDTTNERWGEYLQECIEIQVKSTLTKMYSITSVIAILKKRRYTENKHDERLSLSSNTFFSIGSHTLLEMKLPSAQ